MLTLADRIWVRMLHHAAHAAGKPFDHWGDLERHLVAHRYGETYCRQRIEVPAGLAGVAREGASPETLSWLLAHEEGDPIPKGAERVNRKVSGAGAGRNEQRWYLKLALDAVEVGEELWPGTAAWRNAPFYGLAGPFDIGLGEVRRTLRSALGALGLTWPSLEERRKYIGEEAYQARTQLSEAQMLEQYREHMKAIVTRPSPAALTLIVGLVRESWLDDRDALLGAHRDLAAAAFRAWLAVPLMDEIRAPIEELLLRPLLTGWHATSEVPTDPRVGPIPIADWVATVQQTVPWPVKYVTLPTTLDIPLASFVSSKRNRFPPPEE